MVDNPEIKTDEKVTYGSLTDKFLEWLKTSCNNIGSYKNIDGSLTNTSYSTAYTGKLTSEHPPVSTARNTNYEMNMAVNSSTSITSTTFPIVTAEEVATDFKNFMAARGIDADHKSNTPVIATGLLSFWNNVASFCSARIFNVCGMYASDKPVRLYKKGTVSYTNVPAIPQQIAVDTQTHRDLYTGSDVQTFLDNLETTIGDVKRVHTVTYSFSTKLISSSCCSSSCSSSSSSSSSSSCSCIFIGYMKLPS